MNKIEHPEISIVLPCFNEEEAIPSYLAKIQRVIADHQLSVEVILVDNASIDASLARAKSMQADFPELRIVSEPLRGYGNACRRGFREAKGMYLYLADCDGSYDANEIPIFISVLRTGVDMVIGNRFKRGRLSRKVMPLHRRYLGNPLLSLFVKLLSKVKVGDIHCGARAVSREALRRLHLHAEGMELASEMIMKAARQGLTLEEVAIAYHPRIGTSKLHSVRDGWRHIRFVLLYSPLYLFFIPGVLLLGLGSALMALLYFSTLRLFGIQLFVHPMFLASAMIILGYQLVFFAFFSKIYAITHLEEKNAFIQRLFKLITIERAGFVGIAVCLIAAFVYAHIFTVWVHSGFGSLDAIKDSVIALTLFILGAETFFSAFILSMVGIRDRLDTSL